MTATIELTGEVARAGDSGDEAARIGWNRLYARYSEEIVFCADAQDVVNAVEWTREGHSPACPQRGPPTSTCPTLPRWTESASTTAPIASGRAR
jgi:hypothetical protein